ncbi:MAG: tetratricopeptide repeat protein, partial [Bacteroidales bacterium]|nr:tetratricopeptide repeat protein [Bacteroidales bacterium]
RGAAKQARKRLGRAAAYLKDNLYTAFYEELHKALLGFISDKLLMDAGEMNRENIASRLAESGVDEASVKAFVDLLDACEYARYAPSEGHEAMAAHYEAAVDSIARIDGEVRRAGKDAVHRAGARVSLLLLPLMLLFSASMQAAPAGSDKAVADSLWAAGAQAYTESDYSGALGLWMQISDSGLESPDLYCNIGDAYYKSRDLAHAILYYERALRLNPSHQAARHNLEFVSYEVRDRIDSVPEFFLKTWVRKLSWSLPSTVWAWLFLVLIAGTLAMLLLFLLSKGSAARRTGFFTGIALLVLSIFCLLFAARQRSDYSAREDAIITAPVVSAGSTPGGESSKDLFIIHEGTKVKVLENIGGWSNIELADGRQGWVRDESFEII